MRIVVVDDVIENQMLIKKVLNIGGYSNVTTFASALELYAFLKIDQGAPTVLDVDLILMDIMMPDVDGITACKRIKAQPALHDIPVIMVTANADKKSLEASFEAGANDYIRKPFDKTEVLTRVRAAIRLKKEMDDRKQRENELIELKLKLERTNFELERANTELQRLSSRDGLTGVLNRRIFDEKLEIEWRRTTRESEFISLILLDIDEFKSFNDTYGHQAGDDCLRQVAQVLNETLQRTGDGLFRYGGEEFAAVLPNTDSKGARHVAEILREKVEGLGIPHENSTTEPHVTISIGIATLPFEKTTQSSDLVELADRAMYQAKRAGRNRVIAVDPAWTATTTDSDSDSDSDEKTFKSKNGHDLSVVDG